MSIFRAGDERYHLPFATPVGEKWLDREMEKGYYSYCSCRMDCY